MKIAGFSQNIRGYSGGRVHFWHLITCLCEMGHDVTVYTNMKPRFLANYRRYKQPKIVQANLGDWGKPANVDVRADAYLGSPVPGNSIAAKLAQKYDRPGFLMILDPLPLMRKWLNRAGHGNRLDTRDHYWQGMIGAVKRGADNVKLLCSNEIGAKSTRVWFKGKKRPEDVIAFPAPINGREIEAARQRRKRNWLVYVGRITPHKQLQHILTAIKPFVVELHVVSSGVHSARDLAKKWGIERKVILHTSPGDREKFETMKASRAMVCGSIYEGFGLYGPETLACRVPLVCYDFPGFREWDNGHTVFARWNDRDDLAQKLIETLEANKTLPPDKRFYISNLAAPFSKLIEKYA